MVMKKNKKKKEIEKKEEQLSHKDFGHEIWGIIYIALAVFVLVSLVSHCVDSTSNILGKYLGTALASGLIFLFGLIPLGNKIFFQNL